MASFTIGNGTTVLFWSDCWLSLPLKEQWPHLFSFAFQEDILAQRFITEEDKSYFFQTPLSVEAYEQFQLMLSEMSSIQLSQDKDVWTYASGSSTLTSIRAYLRLIGSTPMHAVYNWLWNSDCLPKRKVFFWLIFKDRLSTRELLRRRNMALDSYNCVLCHLNVQESLHHLFLECPFAMSCWNLIDFAHLIQGNVFQSISVSKHSFLTTMEIIVAMFWAIWSARNDDIFRNIQHSLLSCKVFFKKVLARVKLRVKKDLQPQLHLWIDQ
jgi:hypothetical protein